MTRTTIRKARSTDAIGRRTLLSEWLEYEPRRGRTESIIRAIGNREVLVAESNSVVIGFVHFVMHEDIIDGAPNAFITAFYVGPAHRGRGIGSRLLRAAIAEALERGGVGVETSTTHEAARRLYERHRFKQTVGDIAEVFLELDIGEYSAACEPRSGSQGDH